MSIVSKNVQRRMWDLGITQEKLAEMVGYAGKTSINRIVNGEQAPPLEKIELFAKALKTTPAILCGWDADDDSDDDGRNGYELVVLAKRLKKKDFKAEVFQTKEEAVAYITRECENRTVGLGSSIAFGEMGLIDALKDKDIEFLYASELYRGKEKTKKAINSDVFILSANAISYQTAEMVNISGNGSKISGSLYCADKVIFVVGKNKIAPNLSEAINRTRNNYISKLAKTGGYRTPCAETGKCENCTSDDRLCRTTCIYHNSPFDANITIVLVNESIGY